MDNAIVYLVLGVVIGAAGALVLTGVVLWLRAPSPWEVPSSSESASTSDKSIRLLPISAGEWMVEMGGRRYRRLSEVREAAVARHIQDMLAGLSRFAGRPIVAAPLPDTPAGRTVAPPPASSSDESAFLRSLQAPPARPAARRASPEQPGALGIAGQIEQALQQRLQHTPDVLGREIHVGSAPDGSLRVEVDGRFYAGIDEVPDPIVREALQAAVKDWEAKV